MTRAMGLRTAIIQEYFSPKKILVKQGIEKMRLLEKNEIRRTEFEGGFRPTQRSQSTAFCIVCGIYVRLATSQEAEELYRTNWVEMVRLTEVGSIHRILNSQGNVRFCVNSMQIPKNKDRKIELIVLKPLDVSS